MPRPSKQELQQAIQPQNLDKSKKEKEVQYDDVSYTLYGKHSSLDDQGYPLTTVEKETFARKILSPAGYYNYWVMIGPEGRLFNPYGLLSSSYQAGHKSVKGRSDYQLSKCNQAVFSYYIRFLKTQNAAWIRDAERQM